MRDRAALAADLIGVVGITALALGLNVLRSSGDIGFDVGAAWTGTIGQLATTLPAAILVLAAVALELGAGLVLARLARRAPFESVSEAALAAFVAMTLKGALLVGLLAGFGLYRGVLLIAVDVAILVWGRWLPFGPRVGRLLAAGWLRRTTRPSSIPLAALVAIVWVGPIVLQLASPVVPFIDVLPNHVAPAEQLRTFGSLSPLDATQSPIYGASRALLGIDALLGAISTMTNLPAALATAAFVLPSMLLVAAGVQRLATAVAGEDAPNGPWALLAFAITESFARLADARGTVIVLPLVCLALALAVERCRPAAGAGEGRGAAWRAGPGLAIGLGLGAAVLVHPVIGAFSIATVALLALWRPDRFGPDAAVAGLVAVVIAAPQLGIMLGKSLPTITLAIAIVVAVALGAWAGQSVAASDARRERLVTLARWARPATALGLILLLLVAAGTGLLVPSRLPVALGTAGQLALDGCGVLLIALVLGWLVGSAGARSVLIPITAAIGLLAVILTQLLPGNLGFLGDALRFEVPKTVHYWLPVFVSIGAGAGLAKAVALVGDGGATLPARLRAITGGVGSRLSAIAAVAAAAIVAVAAFPLRADAIDAYHLGEHRLSEAVAIDLHFAGSGFWVGFPNSRTLVDPPRQAILDAVRREIDAGRIAHDTPILHVARSFQEWVSTPLGVFDGVTETFASPDQEVSHQTAGGRLHNMAEVPGLIGGRTFAYVVLEPGGLASAPAVRDQIVAAGYQSIFSNAQGEVFALNR